MLHPCSESAVWTAESAKRLVLQEDSDGDGYISCLQVVLALKDVVPPELLSDEEEVYVYRV